MTRLIGLSFRVLSFVAVAAVAVGVIGVSRAAPAQAAGLRVAVVNYAVLLAQSPQAKAAVASLRAEFEPRQRSLQAQAHALQVRQAQLKRNAATMTQDQRDQAELNLREDYQDLARKQSEIQDDVNTRRNELMSELQKTLVQVVRIYAKQQHYNLVLADGVIYADSALDITPEILRALESQPVRHQVPK